jgi:hypothetical protein
MKRNITCLWGDRKCLGYDNKPEERPYCDDPVSVHNHFCVSAICSDSPCFMKNGTRNFV